MTALSSLSSLLWHWAERERDLMAELKAWAASEQAGDDPALIKKALDALLVSTRDFIPYRDTFAYARRAAKSLKLLEQALRQGPAQELDAAEHELRCLYRVAEHADDSGGSIGDVMNDCIDVVMRALSQQPPKPAWAERFIGLHNDDPFGLWDVNAVLDAAGPEVTHHYSKVLAKRWASIEAGRGKGDAKKAVSWGSDGAKTEADYERDRIRCLLIADLGRQGDPAAVIDFMKRSARSDHDLVDTIVYCEKHGHEREALALAEAAHKRDPKSRMIEDAVLRCWERDGWDDLAFAVRKRRYWHQPALDAYHAQMRTAKAARQSLDALRAEVEAMLIEREKVPPAVPWASTLRSKLQQPPDVTLRAQWLLSEGRSNDALALATGPNQCHPQRLLDVAATLGVSRHAEAFALIDRVAQQTIQRTTGRYDESIDLVSQACARLGSGAARQYLERLRVEYKAKRNFVKGIDALHRPASAA